jgi:transcriptional regulator with XRE-family HTH domain
MTNNDRRSGINTLKIDHDREHGQALWRHIGQRLRQRRTQLGLTVDAVAKELDVSPQTYEQYEAGYLQTPAMLLSDVAQFFRLPVTWFFLDMSFEDSAEGGASEEPGVFAVATDEERVQTLTDYFRSLDLEGQQHLLLVARTLFRARDGSGATED